MWYQFKKSRSSNNIRALDNESTIVNVLVNINVEYTRGSVQALDFQTDLIFISKITNKIGDNKLQYFCSYNTAWEIEIGI